MERPNHDLQLIAQGSKEGKAVSLAITIAIQVGVVLALVAGLAASQLKHELLALNATVERPKVDALLSRRLNGLVRASSSS